MVPLAHPNPQPKWHLDWLRRFCRAHYCDRLTDCATWLVTVGRICTYVVLRCNLIQRHTTVLRPFFLDHPCEPVPEEKFWTLWCKGRLTEADTQTIRLGATPSGLTSAHLHHPPIFLQAGCPSCRPTNSVKVMQPNNKKQLRTSVPPKIVYSEEAESLNSIINNSRTGDIM